MCTFPAVLPLFVKVN